MAITKLSITGNTTSVGISSTPISLSVANKAKTTSVVSAGNITATNVQTALEQLDNIKASNNNATLTNPTLNGTIDVDSQMNVTSLRFSDAVLSTYLSGSWTPSLNLGITYSTSYARVTQVGTLVHLDFKLTNINTENMTGNATDVLSMTGMPINPNCDAIGLIHKVDWTQHGSNKLSVRINTNTNNMNFVVDQGYTTLTKADVTENITDGQLIGTITYFG